MSGNGRVAVDRGVFNHTVFQDEPYSEREAWLWLICEAVWKDGPIRMGRAVFSLQRGQCAISMRFAATKWQWSEARVRRFLDRLKKHEMICVKSDAVATQITICNYNTYQFANENGDAVATQYRRKQEEGNKGRIEEIEQDDGAEAPLSPSKYAFEGRHIKLLERDLERWRKAYPLLSLEAELSGLDSWAGKKGKEWFPAVSQSLAKKNRIALDRINLRRVELTTPKQATITRTGIDGRL
jgi:hypothetical protein